MNLLQLHLEDFHLRPLGAGAVVLGGSGRGVGRQRVLLLVDPTVGALLAVQTQVGLAALAADHRSDSSPAHRAAAVTFAGVTERHMARCNPNSLMIPHSVLAMELQLAAGALEAATFITFKGGFI